MACLAQYREKGQKIKTSCKLDIHDEIFVHRVTSPYCATTSISDGDNVLAILLLLF